MTLQPYPDGLHAVTWEQLYDELVDWLAMYLAYDDPAEAEAKVAELQRRQTTVGTVRRIELRCYDLVERDGGS